MLGVGVMLNMLGGSKGTAELFGACIGKTNAALSLVDNSLCFEFTDGTKIKLYDGGQSCCENRYMCTDDDLAYHVGATLTGGETREAPSVKDEGGEDHDVEFLAIKTDRGEFVMSNHNEHNGYYGGFSIVAKPVS